MKRILLSSISFGAVCLASQAWAAGIAQPAAAFDWSGFYLGGQVGMSNGAMRVGPVNVEDGNINTYVFGDLTQVLAGVHAGYNQQINSIVLGVEADINAAAGEGHYQPTNLRMVSAWNGSLRGRLGVVATPRSMFYATGGLAYGNFKTDYNLKEAGNSEPPQEILGGNRLGWTVGGGLDYALDNNWVYNIEYRYTDWGSKTVQYNSDTFTGSTKSRFSDHRIGVGLSYMFGGGRPSSGDSAVEEAANDWTGLYFGAQVGMSAGQMRMVGEDTEDPGVEKTSYGGLNQVISGVHAGYNYEIDNGLVVGVEGDFNSKSGAGWLSYGSSRPTSNWDGSVRGRLGVAVTPRSLVYGTGGIAFGNFTTPLHEVDPNEEGEYLGGHRTGWTAGGGIEYALDSNWSAAIEYRYTDWGSKTINTQLESSDFTGSSKLHDSSVRVGVSYKVGEAKSFSTDDTGLTDWTGFNVGGQVGASAAHFSYTDVNNPNDKEFGDFTQSVVGGHVGYDYQIQSIVLGVESDLNAKLGHAFAFDDRLRSTSDYDGSIRGRLGLAVTDNALLYGTAGFAFGNFTTPNTGALETNEPNEEHMGGSRTGWTVGGGMKYALDSNWSTGIEYRYTDWGSKTVTNMTCAGPGCPETADSKLTDNRVLVGISLKF